MAASHVEIDLRDNVRELHSPVARLRLAGSVWQPHPFSRVLVHLAGFVLVAGMFAVLRAALWVKDAGLWSEAAWDLVALGLLAVVPVLVLAAGIAWLGHLLSGLDRTHAELRAIAEALERRDERV